MNVSTSHHGDIAVLRVDDPRLTYPMLGDFSSAASGLIAEGHKKILLDLTSVGYVDSATIGCLMDLFRQAGLAGGSLKLSGVQKRVATMLTMTGANNFLEVYDDLPSGLASFGG